MKECGMEFEALSIRQVQVLDVIVRNYILSASPTGSRFIAKQRGFDLSAASIRNVMGDLEELGYITHPHTSAGRIPTDKGYRYYVDRLMKSVQLPAPVEQQIREEIQRVNHSDLHMVLEATTKALSRTTNLLGVILAPRLVSGVFRHVHIYEIEPNRFFMHLTIDSGFVKTIVIGLETTIPAERLNGACQIINDRFKGMTLAGMCEAGDTVFSDVEPYALGIIKLFVPSIKKMIAEETSREEVYTEGEANILMQPEFFNKEKAGAIIEILECKQLLMHILDTGDEYQGRVMVTIGGEFENGQFSSFGIIKTKYQLGNMQGSLGIIGPKRMPYPFLVSAVEYTARTLSDLTGSSTTPEASATR
jgi:heat-inducible transcriptional repressor